MPKQPVQRPAKGWSVCSKKGWSIWCENGWSFSSEIRWSISAFFPPLQATEFLVRRLFETTSGSLKSQQTQIVERVIDSLGQDLFDSFKGKYGDLTPEKQRKGGMLLQIIIAGERIEIGGVYYQLTKLQTIKLLINGLLYTYRNERFHGDAFSPFKSSKTQIKTYAHSYFCLISTYFFISQLIFKHFEAKFDLDKIAETLKGNTTRYNLVFDGQRRK